MAALGGSGRTGQALPNKIDRLRELDKKSLVLESLTSFSFPHAPGLCTRYATKIPCRREDMKKVTISIIPCQGTDDAAATQLRSSRKSVSQFSNETLAENIRDGNKFMGIRMDANDTRAGLQTFYEDILKIEISGPEEQHLTVIDVPGILYVPSPPPTTKTDKLLVRNMV